MSGKAYQVHGAVAVITLDNPPVNGLGFDLRSAIVAGIDAAQGDQAVQAVVLIGAGRAFSGGADIREFGTPRALAEPNLNTVIRIIEASSKPVIAAVGGVAMGGGLELALGCHFRVGIAGTQIALPEVKLGILPGAGGTQRLPRLLGVETALNMIVSGTPVLSEQLKDTPLFDEFVAGDLLAGALAFAAKVVAEQRPLARVRDIKIDYPNAEAFFQFARNSVASVAKNFPAPGKCIDAVAAAVMLPFDEGQKVERSAFLHLVATPESRALRHAFFAERACAKIPDVPEDTPLRKVERVAVIGAGTMGVGIAINFLNAGLPVLLLEMQQEALERGIAGLRKNYEGAVNKGKLKPEQLDARMALLTGTLRYDELKDVDLVIEAVFEEMGVKETVFRKLDEVMKEGAILASNTSTLDLNRIAAATRRPRDVIGMHFFSPANVMKLLEVVRGAATANEVLATVMKLAKKLKKTAVVSGVCDGFIGNRMIEHYGRAAGFLVEEGASPQQVDRALEKWGMAMGPFRMADLAGLDIAWAIRKRRYAEQPELAFPRFADSLCELGRYGQKTGCGWYLYPAGSRDAVADAEVEAMLAAYRKTLGNAPRKILDAEIVERCILALVNEAARLLEEGIAQRASDIDMVYLTGYGFPAHRGGPMLYADELGLYNVERSLRRLAATTGDRFWEPAPLLSRLAASGKTFN